MDGTSGSASSDATRRVLVAGIGNVFLGDDGFGVEVVRRLQCEPPDGDVDVADFGVRAMHLACELADGKYGTAILVDAMARGGEPGTLYTIEAEADAEMDAGAVDAHSLTPATVIAWLRRMDAPCRVIVVGCEPAVLDETMELSPAVAGSIDEAVQLVHDVLSQLVSRPATKTRANTATRATRPAFALECYRGRGGASGEYAAGTELATKRQHSGGRQAGCRGPRRSKRSVGESEGRSPSE